ncbi:MAG: hypothetical protein KJ042_04015 [Deltaproteobacteria bacterium]|nr:hypothetical protein [Deltaproteobacteria bacterium]
MLSALSDEGAEYLLVGSFALAAYGCPRATLDMDIWVGSSLDNGRRVWTALAKYGVPLRDIAPEDFTKPGLVFQVGVAPFRIDVLTSIDGVEFANAWSHHTWTEVDGLRVPVLSREDFVKNKRATGRYKDLADLELLGELDPKP